MRLHPEALLASLVPVLFGCAGAPPPPPLVVAHTEPPAPAPPPLPPSRWIEASGATAIGPALPEGTLVLLGGRRAIVDKKDGSLHAEKAPSPEVLEEIIAVPAAGPGGQRLIARGGDTIYRLDDPLGAPTPLARLDSAITRIGAGPGVVAIWTARSELPLFLDIATGKPKPLAGLPEPPLRAMQFVDAKQGAAVFEAAGLAVTADGGNSWKLAADGGSGEALRMNGLRRRGDALRAYAYADGPDAAVDMAGARVSPLEQPAAPAGEPSILRWIRLTGRDPLDAAVASGIEMSTGGALVASHGLLGRVDTKTGALLQVTEFARGKWMNPCITGRAGAAALVACTLSEEQAGSDFFDPFGVFSVSLNAPELKADKPSLVRNGDADFVAAPTGAAMLLGACTGDQDAEACVRQPDGKWASVHTEIDFNGRGAGPTADGRIAVLRGIFDGDDAGEPDQGAAAPPPPPATGEGDDEAPKMRKVHVSLIDPTGKEQALTPFELAIRENAVLVLGSLEEENDHALHFVIDAGEGLMSVIQPLTRDAATLQKIPGAASGRIRAGHGIAFGEGHILASTDGGGTWSEVQAPPFAIDAGNVFASGAIDWNQIEVSEIGAKFAGAMRVGWGPSEAITEPKPAPEAPRLELPKNPPPATDRVLSCKSDGAAQGTPPLLGAAQIRQALQSKPAAKGTRRETSNVSAGRAGMLDTIALLEEEGPDKKGSAPARWTLKWHDPAEVGGKVREASAGPTAGKGAAPPTGPLGPTPKKTPSGESASMPWGASLRFAAASGARALFALRAGGKNILLRTTPSGSVTAIEVTSDLVPSGEAVFGTEKGEPIAWMHDNTLIVWLTGEAPRAITAIPTHAVRSLGQPTKDGVPVLLSSTDWAILRTVAIPALDKKSGSKPPPPAAPTLDGWSRITNLRREVGALPACAAKPKGARFAVQRYALTAVVDGTGEAASMSLYDVRVASGEACVAAVSSLLTPDRRMAQGPLEPWRAPGSTPTGKPPAKKKPAPTETSGPVAFVRADLIGKRAEGGDRGVAPAAMRKLRCSLDAKP